MSPATRALRFAERHAALLVFLVAFACVAPSLHFPPALDDGWAVLDNPLVHSLSNVRRIFSEPYGYGGGPTLGGPFRPVSTLSFAVNYAFQGRETFGYHLVNALVHAWAAALVVLLARRILGAAKAPLADLGALAAGLLFAVHPVHVEAFTPLVGRTDLLAAALGFSALWLALRPGAKERVLAVAVLSVAILAKESASVLPGLYFVIAWTVPAAAGLTAQPGVRTTEARRALARAGGYALALGLALVPYVVLRGGALASPAASRWFPPGTPALTVACSATRVLAEYLRLLVAPLSLGTDFAYVAKIPAVPSPGAWEWAATAVWVAVLLAGHLLRARRPLFALAVAWTFVALLPVTHVVPIGVLMAERLLYLPSAGFCLWVGAEAAALVARRWPSRTWVLGAGALVLVGLVVRTELRVGDWSSSRALWEAELPKAPRNPVVNNNLALELIAAGDYSRAKERLLVALETSPWYWQAHVNLGIVMQRTGDYAGAALELTQASALIPTSSTPLLFLALNFSYQSDYQSALNVARKAAELAPEDTRIPRYQGEWLLKLGRKDEAKERLSKALALDPANGDAKALLDSLQ